MIAMTITETILQISPSKFHQIPYHAEVNPEIEKQRDRWLAPLDSHLLVQRDHNPCLSKIKYGKTMPCSTLDDFRLLSLTLLEDAILIYFGGCSLDIELLLSSH